MNKEKEIEEMVEIARKYSENFANTPYYKGVKTDMEAIYEAGYRKADEVRKETAKQIFDMVNELYEQANSIKGTVEFKCGALDALNDVLDIFYREYGFEVKE